MASPEIPHLHDTSGGSAASASGSGIGLWLHRSNRVEELVEALAGVVARPGPDVFASECIAVQGRGMERWLSMELSRRLGVWANPEFPFPRRLVERALDAVLGEVPESGLAFDPERLLWSVAELLPGLSRRPEFAPVARYLEGDEGARARLQLAERIAQTFDHYVVYRPEMVLEWERGGGDDWQALLWRALVERHGSGSLARRAHDFFAAVEGGQGPPVGFPTRLCFFGVSTLPPLYVSILAALSRRLELHLFLPSPSREYWADIRSRLEIHRAHGRREGDVPDSDESLHLAEGHPLLASLGRLGRDFQQVLEEVSDYRESGSDLYRDPEAPSAGRQRVRHRALSVLQSDILALRHRCAGNSEAPPLALAPGDDSILVHSCHGPMREVEVLHDQLLALFEADPDLEPRHVVVMAPDIETYAPLVEAVFGGGARRAAGDGGRAGDEEGGDGRARIPCRIADRAVRTTSEVVDAFSKLLDAASGRMTASEVLDLLGAECIRSHFGIAVDELDRLVDWVERAGIRWGVDAAHRASLLQPACPENTWRFGLDRLLLGYAMQGKERDLYRGVLPFDDLEGTETDLLGRFTEFCEALFACRELLERPRSVPDWCDALAHLQGRMLSSTSDTAQQHLLVRNALAELASSASRAGFGDAVSLDTFRAQLDRDLAARARPHGFLSGGVTFCEMVPMRTIPFRVVCLMGMNDDAFPRTRHPVGFDLIARLPAPGDRSVRDDDRYLFLEALLSARDHLLITYVGQGIRDNATLPPSVVVSELLDCLAEGFELPAADPPAERPSPEQVRRAVRQRLVLPHPLQPFSPRYFGAGDDERLMSYVHSDCEGARALLGERRDPAPFLSGPLPLEEPAGGEAGAVREVDVEELVRFFEQPARSFLRSRLGLSLPDEGAEIPDREPMSLEGLARWQLGDALLSRAIAGEDLSQAATSVRAAGALPLGVPGELVYEELAAEVSKLATRSRSLREGVALEPLLVDATLAGTRIVGSIGSRWPVGLVRHQFSKLGGRQELGLWIRHLVLSWLCPPDCSSRSHLVGRPAGRTSGTGVVFGPLEDPQTVLRDLIELYWLGQTLPLPLFARSSRAYAERLQSARQQSEFERRRAALEAARQVWDDSYAMTPEKDDPFIRQLFRDLDPLSPDFEPAPGLGFEALASRVFGPLLACREEVA